ncbi:MAG: GYF domain-containing protein [Verrucomicrobiota bacterium]
MQWYYSKNSSQLGPVSEAELRSKIASGEISPSDLVWKEGMSDWTPAGNVAEFVTAAGVPPVLMPGYQQSPYTQPSVAPGAAPQGGGKAITALILGICSIVFSFICPPFSLIISIPCAIFAFVFGLQFKRAVAAEPRLAGHSGKATGGMITGIIGLILSVIMGVLSVFWFSYANKTFAEEFRKEMEKARQERSAPIEAPADPSTR